ncbi:MAG TPA: hypothetical protein VMJ30_07185 [Gemmatimonadales bacterium]|nr:hypothetical protein [Gemmatimonadales bacterium]
MSSSHSPAQAIERLAEFFAPLESRQGVLARRLLGRPRAGDAELSLRLARQFASQVSAEGTVAGGLAFTAFRLIELIELGCDEETPAVPRLIKWLAAQQDAPGCYSEGCAPPRHEKGVCEHFLSGFLSPGPADVRVAPVTIPNGKVFRAEPAARFALSCLGLRALLLTPARTYSGVKRHLTSLARLKEAWGPWNGYFPPDLVITALTALATAGSAERAATEVGVKLVSDNQAADGGWPETDRFVALEALVTAGTTEAREAVRRSIGGLISRQRADGSFGPVAQHERCLIALRALLFAA